MTRRLLLAVVLIAATLSWSTEPISAAAPAELISVNTGIADQSLTDYYEPSVSGDGKIVAFSSSPNNFCDFSFCFVRWSYVRDRGAGTTTAVPAPFNVNQTSNAVLSRDGCHVAFWGFFPLFTINFGFFVFTLPAQWDIYEWDRCTADSQPSQISVAADFPLFDPAAGGQPGPLAISADGHYVAYAGIASTGSNSRVARIDSTTLAEAQLQSIAGITNSLDISDDGAFIATGTQISARATVVFGWTPPCVVGAAVVCNTEVISAGPTGRVSGASFNPSVSADGRYVAFASNSADILGLQAPTSTQVYVRDRANKVSKLVSPIAGQPVPGSNDAPEISPDGSQIALVQRGAQAVTGAPGVAEVYVARTTSGFFDSAAFDLVSYGISGAPTSQDSFFPSMSSNGRFVAFESGANKELSATPINGSNQIWMRDRPIALDITPSLDFGTIDPGSTSPPQTATVKNTSAVPINIGAVAPPAGPFAITANTCGGPLKPGASCVITLVFSPTVGGGANSSLPVSGDGLSVSVSLSGVGRQTLPIPGSLKIKPTAANYGGAIVGTPLGAKKFVVTNPGQSDVTIGAVGLSGTGADQFAIASNTCAGVLAAGASCNISVSAIVTRAGAMTATLGVIGTAGESTQATLRISGFYNPALVMNPGVVGPGQVTIATGIGFPASADVQLGFPNELPFATVHTEPDGSFRYSLLAMRNSVHQGGSVQVLALDQPGLFTGVFAPLLITLGTFRPSGSTGPAFNSGVTSMLSRG